MNTIEIALKSLSKSIENNDSLSMSGAGGFGDLDDNQIRQYFQELIKIVSVLAEKIENTK